MTFNLGNVSNALAISNGGNGGWKMPDGVNDALKRTGSSYSVPQAGPTAPPLVSGGQGMPEWAQQGQQIAKALPDQQAQELDENGQPKARGLMNSPAAGLVKKAAGLVASFYTGGMSGLALNAGSQMVGQNNPKAGNAIGMAGSLFG